MSSTQQQTTTNNNNNQNNNNQNNASGKTKGKQKKKGEKLDVELYFANPTTTPNWATMMENDTESELIVPPSQYNLPEAPKALSNEIDLSQIPPYPPFRVTLRNLHYDIVENDLETHFRNFNICDVQLNRDGRLLRSATISFKSKQDLIHAFEMKNKSLKGRNFVMFLGSDRYGERGYDRTGGDRRGRGLGRDNTPNDWRSSRDVPPKTIYPPPSLDYEQPRGYNRTGPRGNSSRYGGAEDEYPPPRNDYGRGTYDDRPDDDRYDDRYGRGPRNDYHSSSRSGNWDRDRMPSGSNDPELADNWRRGPPAQTDLYEPQRRGPTAPRYEEQRAMPPPRMTDTYRNDSYGDDYRPQPPQVNDRLDRRHETPIYDRRQEYDIRRDDRRGGGNDYERSGHRNPPLMDHPQRERLPSIRSNVSDQQLDDQYDRPGVAPPPPQPSISASPKERKSLINDSILEALKQNVSDSKPASYSSIFGEAKPVDTSQREMEIEQKFQNSKPLPPTDLTTAAQTLPPPRGDDGTSRDYHDSIPPRHAARRTNGGIGNRTGQRRDYDNDRNGALGGDRRGPRGPRVDVGRMRPDRRDVGREYYGDRQTGDRRRYGERDRIGGRRMYGDEGLGPRYQDQMQRGYENERNRYHTGENDYIEWSKEDKDDSKPISYATTNKFDHLGETDDHGSE